MSPRYLPNLAALSVAGSLFLTLIPVDLQAQTNLQTAQSNHLQIEGIRGEDTITGVRNVPGIGKVFSPTDDMARAFPGDHFTPRQRAMLEAQGIRTVADFVATDAAIIARLVGAPRTSVSKWQREIKTNLR
ncbi:hypothetical protein [Roseinatronobacter bogoriensis]|uniref:Uncharacterized protein n=1 Tax=Roseinatronobacter bogoriensis subsp. barguzinensis TaxID=441209 RepID=A0A2K8KJU9_9RHOB|nr:hypothetical protein [Rhodobaca]ATX67268.1 hypothetical protein BG454_16820 [Rhodobaca barguzinensis]MBB4206821.1 hypothetical protein [Rhodobaca bogoriensis DSM 18756]TDW41565.1 hypothetical protein LY39_00672 [Rhodobaca barguzinensis]TDY74257.1 hypothetical protein EV660_101293 [Rhodobaca bogoriensis DSM 18756]